ncbi:MAG: hypothetical protein VX764_09530 [Planctomycetota bacterium]|nr:hypothetical protein [Planctomycetota bacterium]
MRQLFLITTIVACSTAGVFAQTGGDECDVADPIVISGFGTYVTPMDNTTATTGTNGAPVIPCAVVGQFTDDIWFSFSPDADGAVDVSTCDPAGWDTDLLLYDGTSGCASLSELACNGDTAVGNPSCQNFHSEFETPTPVFAGTTYYLRVGNWGASGAGGTGNLTINFFPIGTEICDDGADNDSDGQVDCFDTDCAGIPPCGAEAGQCDDGIDNDADGLTDCCDDDCIGDPACAEADAVACDDGIDNDCDGIADCADPDCSGFGLCGPEICDDAFDNDGDGLIDCFDTLDCIGTPACPAATNDECVDATDIPIAGPGAYSAFIDSTSASLGTDPLPAIPCAVMGQFDSDIWFSFVPDQDMVAEIHTCDPLGWDTDLLVYEDPTSDCSAMIEVGCNGDSTVLTGCQAFYSHVQFLSVTAGTTYRIRIGSYGLGVTGVGTVTVNMQIPSTEICNDGIDNDIDGAVDCLDPDCFADPVCTFTPGDECFVAIEVFDGPNPIDNLPFTSSTDPPVDYSLCLNTGNGAMAFDGWYLYEATESGDYWVHTCDPGAVGWNDTDVLIYDFTAAGEDCSNLAGNEIACNGDSFLLPGPCQNWYSLVEVNLVAGNRYMIRTGTYSTFQGTGTLTILPLSCPPMTGLSVATDCDTGDATLNWDANSYDSIELTRDGALIATLPGTDTSYVDLALAPGSYTYEAQGICATSTSANQVVVANVAAYAGETDIIFGTEGIDDIDSVAALQAALDANGIIYVTTTLGPAEWGCLNNDAITRAWMMTGTYPNDYRISDADGAALAAAIENGTNVYFEGGDHWGFVHLVTPYDNYDGVDQDNVVDGDDTFLAMNGADTGFGLDTSDLNGTAYNQAGAAGGSDWTDQIGPLAGSAGPNVAQVWADAALAYGTGVCYLTDPPNGNTINQSWEFGGFGGDQTDLAARYIAFLGGGGPTGPHFGRGDCNADGAFNIADAIYTLASLFSGGPPGPCEDSCDSNGDGGLNIADAIFTLAALFSSGPQPSAPESSECDVDGDDSDPLGCVSFPPCP